MRVGIAGKGGVGKTTISSVLARELARRGHNVIAVDCDSDPHLAMNSGIAQERIDAMRPFVERRGQAGSVTADAGATPVQLLSTHGMVGPDGVTYLLASRITRPGGGWTGASHVTVRGFIERVESELPATVVIADMEAGLEHLSWAGGTLRYVDALLLVAEPQSKVLLTARRAHALATQLGVERIAFVGNRARPGEEQRLEEFAASLGSDLVAVVPEDPAVAAADRNGVCPLDSDPESPAVRAIRGLADGLESRYLAAAPDRPVA